MRRSKITELAISRQMTGGGSSGGGGTDERFKQLVEGTITEINDSEITKVGRSTFLYFSNLVSVNLPNATSLGQESFKSCSGLVTAYAPKVKSIGTSAFSSCYKLENIDFSSLQNVPTDGFAECRPLKIIDLPVATSLGVRSFQNCFSLIAVILRTDAICSLLNTSAFNGWHHFNGTAHYTYNPEGKKDGYTYVPRKWLSDEDETMDYRRATNWTALGEDRFRALEDYTVDGTTTGELDWEKVNA